MKILILSSEFDPYRGGIGTYARELALSAVELGHTVEFVAPDYGSDQSALDQTFPFRVRRYAGGQHTMKDLPAKIRLVRNIAKEAEGFDLVHAVDWPFFVPLALSGFRGRAKCLVTFHGTEITYMRKKQRSLPLGLLRFWSGWTRYVTNSRFTTKLLMDSFPAIKESEVMTIGLGVRNSWREGRLERSLARQQAGIASDRFVIISLGRVVRRKGHLVLAEALAKLPRDIAEKIDWFVIGPHYDEQYISELRAASESLPARASITGPLPEMDLKRLLSAGDLFCLPGYWDDSGQVEGFGLAFVEAGAFGLPSVATDVGGVPDAVLHGKTGLLVKPRDPVAVAEAILRLYRDEDYRMELARGAVRYADDATWTNIANETYGLCSNIV